MKAVIFDVDGTLVDSVDQHAKAWKEALARFGHRVPFERIRSQIGKGGDQLMPVFLSEQEVATQAEELERYRTDWFRKNYLAQVRPFPGVRELMRRLLDDGWKIALASSAKGEELKIYKELCQISDLLEAETSSDDAEKSKPHPDIFQAAVSRLKLQPAECFVVGDSPYDAEAACRAGIRSIGFLCGGFPREELTAAGFETLYGGAEDAIARYEASVFHEERPVGVST